MSTNWKQKYDIWHYEKYIFWLDTTHYFFHLCLKGWNSLAVCNRSHILISRWYNGTHNPHAISPATNNILIVNCQGRYVAIVSATTTTQYSKHQIEVNEVINRENLAPGHSPNMNIPA